MKAMKSSVAILAGLASIAGLSLSAQAQTVLNIAGASAAKPFVEEVPLTLCDNPTGPAPTLVAGATAPRVYMDGALGPVGNRLANSKFITYVCEATNTNVGLPSIIVRYQSTGSSAGIDKPNAFPTVNNDGSTPNPAAREVYVLENASSCNVTTTTETDGLGRTRTFHHSCTQFSPSPSTNPAGALVVNLGVADVDASSFNQTSVGQTPGGTAASIIVGPRNSSNIASSRPVVVPFSIVLGSAVKTVDTANGTVLGPVRNLTQLQIEAIFSRSVTRWNQLSGLGADVDGNGSITNDNQTIILCQRRAGSGTKAAFDQTLMKDANEHTGGSPLNSGSFNLTLGTPANPSAGPTTLSGISNNDVRDCVQGNPAPTIPSNDPYPFPGARPAHPTAAAYMEAEQAATVIPTAGYVVSVDGGKVLRNDTAGGHVPPVEELVYVGNEKENVRCGKYQYWVFEAFNTRIVPAASANEQTLITAFLTQAEDPNIINNLPNVGRYWVSPQQMHVNKNQDKGPVLWKSNVGSAPACLAAVNNIP